MSMMAAKYWKTLSCRWVRLHDAELDDSTLSKSLPLHQQSQDCWPNSIRSQDTRRSFILHSVQDPTQSGGGSTAAVQCSADEFLPSALNPSKQCHQGPLGACLLAMWQNQPDKQACTAKAALSSPTPVSEDPHVKDG
jgi:hypothetical protein